MKRMLLVLIPLLLVGGTAGVLHTLKVFPFGKAAAKPMKAAPASNAEVAQTADKPGRSTRNAAQTDSASHARSASQPPSVLPYSPHVAASPRPSAGITADEEKDLTRLSSVYEQMPSEDAGKILTKLPDSLLEKLLRRMDERQVGKVLLTFGPERAAKLTVALAREKPVNSP